jgi:hypothetical protein
MIGGPACRAVAHGFAAHAGRRRDGDFASGIVFPPYEIKKWCDAAKFFIMENVLPHGDK